MATVTTPRRTSDRAEAQRRVIHPLHSLRFFIRSYVTVEGVLVLLLYLAVCFWLGVAFDYGFFKLGGLLRLRWIDWVDVLPWGFRAVVLGLFVLGMVAVVGFKVISRLFREFRDGALAMVLERRFPQQLGDRLITAVELADPQLAKHYGYSQEMVDHTVRDAADRVEKLPVRQVFNWTRLAVYGVIVAFLTVGLYLGVGAIYCLAAGRGPVDFAVRFHHVASIWFERNILLADTYWPRRTQLELLAPEFPDNPDTLHHNRNEPLPPVRVRAVKWVVADRDRARYPLGWRPLRWGDLTPELLGAAVPAGQQPTLLADWPAAWEQSWTVDQLDLQLQKSDVKRTLADQRILEVVRTELARHTGHTGPGDWRKQHWADLNVEWPAEVLSDAEEGDVKPEDVHPSFWPAEWQTGWTLGYVEKQFQKTEGGLRLLTGTLGLVGAGPLPAVAGLGLKREDIDAVSRTDADAAVYRELRGVLAQLDTQADSPWMERRLRKLVIPQTVMLYYEGASMDGSGPLEPRDNNEYFGTFRTDVHESIRFTVNGEDFYTPYKRIELVPPPRLVKLSREEFQPAYIYHRAPEQAGPAVLKGKRHLLHNLDVPGDDRPVISVPAGTTLILTAEADKDLKEVRIEWRVNQPAPEGAAKEPKKADEVHVLEHVPIADDRRFQVSFDNVTKPIQVDFEFTDTTRLKGRRQVQIQPVADAVPVVDVQVEVLRKTNQGYLITAWNLVPFSGKVTDDHGLSRLEYEFTVTPILSQPANPVTPAEGAGALQLAGTDPTTLLAAPAYLLTWLRSRGAEAEPAPSKPYRVPLETFRERLQNWPPEELPLAVLLPDLQKGPSLPHLEDALLELRGAQDRLDQLAEQLPKVQRGDLPALVTQVSQVQEIVTRNRDRLVQAQGSLRQFRETLVKEPGTEPALLTKKLDRRVLAPIDAAVQEFAAAESAIGSLQQALENRSADAEAVARVKAPLDKLRDQLAQARDGLQKEPAHGPAKFKDFKVEPDLNFDPSRGDPRGEGFDLKNHLSFLKERDENKPQPHYRVQVQLVATDNNIEGTPGVGKSKETFTFLVVSDNELLNDIGKEEESLRLKLEDAISILQDARLKLGRVSVDMQGLKPADDFRDVTRLTEDTKEDVAKSGDKVREVYTDYKRILDQMKFGRVAPQMIGRVKDGICDPLDLALTREFVQVDEALNDLHTTLRAANPDLKGAEDARAKMDALIARLNKVLDSMRQITTINTLIEKLVKIEKALREEYDLLADRERKKTLEILKALDQSTEKPK
jgi:hypothetical protein